MLAIILRERKTARERRLWRNEVFSPLSSASSQDGAMGGASKPGGVVGFVFALGLLDYC